MSAINATISGFGIAIVIIQALIVLPVCYYSIAQVVVYSNKLRFVLKNSFIMTLIRFPYNFLFIIIHPGILVVLFTVMDITAFIGVGLAIFLSGIGYLLWSLNALDAFDKYINKENHPDYYKKGLIDEYKEA